VFSVMRLLSRFSPYESTKAPAKNAGRSDFGLATQHAAGLELAIRLRLVDPLNNYGPAPFLVHSAEALLSSQQE
jgi:hypothetical protein